MAIKILTPGDPNRKPTYKRTCPECGCVFEYQYEDTRLNNYSGGYVEIACPCCSYPIAHCVAGSGEDINHPKEVD